MGNAMSNKEKPSNLRADDLEREQQERDNVFGIDAITERLAKQICNGRTIEGYSLQGMDPHAIRGELRALVRVLKQEIKQEIANEVHESINQPAQSGEGNTT
jgi:hypothetical protein